MDWADRLEGPSEEREFNDKNMFEQLVSEHGTGWVLSMVSASADTMDQEGAGDSALIGIVTGGASMLVVNGDDVNAVVDPEHQWLFTFAASVEALREIRNVVDETITALETRHEVDGQLQLPDSDDLG